jgi:hypothetical protein
MPVHCTLTHSYPYPVDPANAVSFTNWRDFDAKVYFVRLSTIICRFGSYLTLIFPLTA